jgi:hypothetical protein
MQVVYDNQLWKAKWWTKGDVPGVAAVWLLEYECPSDPNQLAPGSESPEAATAFRLVLDILFTDLTVELSSEDLDAVVVAVQEKYMIETPEVLRMEVESNALALVLQMDFGSEAQANTRQEWLQRDTADGSLQLALNAAGVPSSVQVQPAIIETIYTTPADPTPGPLESPSYDLYYAIGAAVFIFFVGGYYCIYKRGPKDPTGGKTIQLDDISPTTR